jgi:uncharacterized protein (TIRG00374 family)
MRFVAMKNLHAILLVLGLVFLTYLVSTIGVGELWHELTSLGWGLIPLILIEGVADLVHTMGWRRCLSGPHRSLPLVVLFCIRMAGFAINYLTPTASLGGEVTKATLLASNHRGPEAASGVLIGKLCFAFAHLLFVVAGSMTILWRIKLPRALWVGMLISSALLAGGMVAFLLIQKYGKLGVVVRWLVAHKLGGRLLERAARDITEVDEALKLFYRKRPWDLPLGVCWHLLGYGLGIFQTWFFFYLLNQDASFVVAAGAWVLSLWFDLLTFAIPLRLGTLEGSRIVAFKAVGSDALLGMTYGVALRLAELVWAGFGLVSYGLLSRGGHLRDA